jgi:hypothetical protein
MNIYEQLESMRSELAERDAKLKTLQVMDQMIRRAASQRDSGLSVSRLQVLRHVMSMPEVLNDEDVRLDMLGLEGDLEDAAAKRAEAPRAAYEEDRRPKLKKYYKKK